jgi:hypothetical protein
MKTGKDAILTTQAQCAEHRGVSRQHISNLAKRGVLARRGPLVDVQASEAGGRQENRLAG